MGRFINRKACYKIYMTLITSILLGYYAYETPFNSLLDSIRQSGLQFISFESVSANIDLVISAVVPRLTLWTGVFILWVALVILGNLKNGKLAEILFGRIVVTPRLLTVLFYVGAIIEMIWASLFYATFHLPFATVLVFVAMQCFAVKIVLTEHNKKEWIVIGCLVALGIACEFYTTRGFVLRVVLLVLASDGIDKKQVMKYYLAINAFASIIIISLSGLGIAGNWIEYDAYRSIEEVNNRYVCGFNSPNTTHYVIIRLALIAMYIWWDKIKLWHILAVFGANYALYVLTDSRTGFLVGLVTCILAVFFKYCHKMCDWKLWSYFAIVMIMVLALFSIHFLKWDFYQYDTLHECPTYVYKVNDIMVGRIHQALKFTQDIELSPFGTRKSGVYCDMGYIKLFLQEGFVFFFLYIIMLIKLIWNQHRNKDYMGYIIVVAISLRMFMESSFVPFVFQNIIWMLVIGSWNQLERKDEAILTAMPAE